MFKSDAKKRRQIAKSIMEKYDNDLFNLEDQATATEVDDVMAYIADESNHKQRIIAGLDKDDEGLVD